MIDRKWKWIAAAAIQIKDKAGRCLTYNTNSTETYYSSDSHYQFQVGYRRSIKNNTLEENRHISLKPMPDSFL
ncbi:hypothetical protein HC752_12915 [Vibrio sp. S9_S30]|uniref:hypothetical protein n=1 Tax=Vibrio sp. S9_S30 TaxID=2720226 RepID=UPI001680AEBC|nr:hypothetical protein [Vibrio sp. S9_S30]MBD1557835.1 hypothetical protein [Vibrio sp. S9_S30]